jgi:hypothetical protein
MIVTHNSDETQKQPRASSRLSRLIGRKIAQQPSSTVNQNRKDEHAQHPLDPRLRVSRGVTPAAGNGLTFGSREAGAEGYAIPQLEIQTAVVPEPAEAAALSALGLAAFGLVRRLRRSRDNPRHDVCRSSRCTSAQYQ